MTAAQLVTFGEMWLWIGALIAALFLTIGIDRIDEDARGAYVFRVLLIPATLLLWPLVILRWIQIELRGDVSQSRYRPVRAAHGVIAPLMSLTILALVILAWNARQDWPADIAPVQLSAGPSQ